MGWKSRLAVGGACCCVALLAPQAAAWLERGGQPPRIEAEWQPFLEAALREQEVLRPDLHLDPREVVSIPVEARLAAAHEQRFRTTIQWLNRCTWGDALVTVERLREGATWVVVHRGGKPCFRFSFPDGPDQSPASLQVHGTIDASGGAGPLAVIHTHPLVPLIGEGGLVVKREAVHFLVLGLDGRILLERGIETSAPSLGSHWGAAVSTRPLVWDGSSLLAWASARRWEGTASQCVGSLLRLAPAGPIAVAEGVPCDPVRAIDVDGDGVVELAGATRPVDGVPWEAVVDASGDFVSTAPPREEEIRFDWDGDGAEERFEAAPAGARVLDPAGTPIARVAGVPLGGRIDGARRELLLARSPCSVFALAPDGAGRCAPGDVGVLGSVVQVAGDFDWTGDGSADTWFLGPGAASGAWQVVWAEGDLTFAWEARSGWARPRHQAPRALSLSGRGGPEVLLETEEGFEIRSVPGGEVRWTGLTSKGVLDAWALPAAGTSAIAAR